jgi:mono/diheme cytochrome c family protein
MEMEMNRMLMRWVAVLVTLSPFVVASWVHAQQNGEARATVPTVVTTDYNMRTFMAPLPLNETELKGRKLFAQRCANCHGGTAQRPGPVLGQQTVERLGDASIREKVRKGSLMMPGFEYGLEPARIDQIIAFLKTVASTRGQTAAQQ